jgi:hypothetical protein
VDYFLVFEHDSSKNVNVLALLVVSVLSAVNGGGPVLGLDIN